MARHLCQGLWVWGPQWACAVGVWICHAQGGLGGRAASVGIQLHQGVLTK